MLFHFKKQVMCAGLLAWQIDLSYLHFAAYVGSLHRKKCDPQVISFLGVKMLAEVRHWVKVWEE